MPGGGKGQRRKEMQIGDTIKCSSMEEATEYGKQLLAQGWDVKSESDFRTGQWILTITGKKEPKAADDESKYPEMDEMIKACEEKKDPDETIVFALGVGRMVPLPFDKKAVKKGIEEGLKFIKKLDGFLGVHPIDANRNLLLFDTLNNAKGGSNMLKSKDVPVGQIVPILIKTEFLEGKNGH